MGTIVKTINLDKEIMVTAIMWDSTGFYCICPMCGEIHHKSADDKLFMCEILDTTLQTALSLNHRTIVIPYECQDSPKEIHKAFLMKCRNMANKYYNDDVNNWNGFIPATLEGIEKTKGKGYTEKEKNKILREIANKYK